MGFRQMGRGAGRGAERRVEGQRVRGVRGGLWRPESGQAYQ
jgi:hypothetical protein